MRLILGDCIEEMGKLVKEGVNVDLTVTSPPYDNLRTYNDLNWNEEIWKEIIKKLYSIIKDGGIVVWIVNDATINGDETGTSFKQALYFKEVGFRLHDTMIYKKKCIKYPDIVRYYSAFEYMFVFSKGKPKTFNPIKDRKNKTAGYKMSGKYRKKDGSFHIHSNTGQIKKPYGVRINIWEYAIGNNSTKDKIAYQHPAIMPEKLAKDHIISWSNEGDTVLDPFMGSGTTGIACKKLNREFIGIEIDKDYYEIAKKRIGDTEIENENQLDLFEEGL